MNKPPLISYLVLFFFTLVQAPLQAKVIDGTFQALTPVLFLTEVYGKNPELAAGLARVQAEESAVSSKYALANPRLGVMRESNLTADQRQMGDMQSWVFSQEIMFPTKYFSMAGMQKAKANATKEEFLDKKLEIRQKALTQYYNFYSAVRISSLLEAQRETIREIARIAESRRATGAASQLDEMKAHLEQTKIENEILLQEQEVSEFEASLKALLNRDVSSELVLPKGELAVPLITAAEGQSSSKILDLALKNSKMISAQKAWLGEAESARSFSRMGYLPDFMVSYTKPFGTNAPDNAYSFSVEMSIPLWFFARQNSETSVAAAKNMEAEKNLERTYRQIESETKGMAHKVETLSKLLKIYDTALIPQAISALNSSRSAYRTGRVGFQELLDAERSLYSVRIEYYRNYSKFVETLSSLERTVGVVISDLPTEKQPESQP